MVTNSNLFDCDQKYMRYKNIKNIIRNSIQQFWRRTNLLSKSFKAFKNREKIKKSYQSSITRLQVKYYKQDIPTAICTPIKTKKTLNPYPSSTVPSSTISGPRKTSTRIIQKRSPRPPIPASLQGRSLNWFRERGDRWPVGQVHVQPT